MMEKHAYLFVSVQPDLLYMNVCVHARLRDCALLSRELRVIIIV